MQIKPGKSKSGITNDKVAVLEDGRKIVMEIDTKDLLKDKGANYYALYKGANAYFFDNPAERIHNCVLVKCGKDYFVINSKELIEKFLSKDLDICAVISKGPDTISEFTKCFLEKNEEKG